MLDYVWVFFYFSLVFRIIIYCICFLFLMFIFVSVRYFQCIIINVGFNVLIGVVFWLQSFSKGIVIFDDIDVEDCSRLDKDLVIFQDWCDFEFIKLICDCFVIGDWNKVVNRGKIRESVDDDNDDMFRDDEVFGDFEDLEIGE